ncbi:MAG: hypothetical protein IPM50_01945 [Acidobacteriota bacterium]|nr:MAG: hypothetical protein IPM50_01945 [Acidobacteriota bacterium]
MKKTISYLLFVAIYIGHIAPMASIAQGRTSGKTMDEILQNTSGGLTFRLSEGVDSPEPRTVQTPAATDPLSDGQTSGLLGRLPAIKQDRDDTSDFQKRAGTLPAPKTGEKVPVKFPADGDAPTRPVRGDGKTLEVVRFSPEGEVSLAPDLSITFSQPMVAVTSQDEAAKYAPVEISPQVEGRWRWLGTRTLMFDTDKRFPMATKFTARVPAGTKSATGQVLQKDFSWTFTTPPPKAIQMFPNGGTTRRNVLMFAAFDQAINPEAVLRMINATGGGKRLALRLAAQAEIDADSTVSYYSKQAHSGRWLAFRAVNADGSTENALPGDSQISVVIEKGTPSAEGSLTTSAPQSFGFRTFGPMKFVRAQCGWSNDRSCSPFEQWQIQFSNSIDPSKFDKKLVKIEPAIEDANIYPSGNYIYIQGTKKGKTAYRITVDGTLADIYGQELGTPASATINIGSAEAVMFAQGQQMLVVDPFGKPGFSIYSTNHRNAKVRMYKVGPDDWQAFQQYVRYMNYDDGRKPAMPGRLVFDKVIPIAAKPDEMVETNIELTSALDGGFGNVIVDIEPTVKRDQYDRTRIVKWIQATQIGLDAFVDSQELVAFVTELKTGKPITGVDLSIGPDKAAFSFDTSAQPEEPGYLTRAWNWLTSWGSSQADEFAAADEQGNRVSTETIETSQTDRTGENGILRLPLPTTAASKGQNYLVARKGKDVAFLPENADYYWQDTGTWYKRSESDSLRWFVFDDRRIYKPKEEVAVKGYIRLITGGKFGDVQGLGDAVSGFSWSVKDPRNNEIAKGEGNLNAFGAFDLKFKLPDNANLGNARIDLIATTKYGGSSTSHQFQIQEFRRPEFEVSAKVETEAPHFVGANAMLSVEAKYYAGGPLANADTNWVVTATATNYTPPNRDDFIFGTWIPWWRMYDRGGFGRPGFGGGSSQSFKGVTDASGKHILKVDFDSVKPPRPYAITANASVQDVNRQTWASSTSLLVHPASLYVGIKTQRTFVPKGEKMIIESIVADIDGNLVENCDVEIKAVLKDWRFDAGSWKEVTVDDQTCNIRSSQTPSKCEFVAKAGGRYTITATVMDDRERFNQSEFTIWVPGGKTPPKREVEQEEVEIIPSKKEFAPGETAELLVIAPFAPAEGVLTLRRDGIVKTERFTIKDSSITLRIPIEERYLPNIHAQVDLTGSAPRMTDAGEPDDKLPRRPAFASGGLDLSVSTASRKLRVTADPVDKTLTPGGETKLNVAVTDHRGEPVANSEVAVVVVDESVLALTRYTVADPVSVFYTARGEGVNDFRSRGYILLGNPKDIAAQALAESANTGAGRGVAAAAPPMAAEMRDDARMKRSEMSLDGQSSGEEAIELRQNFDALALFAPSVKTDSNGRAVVNVKLPDNLTRYRITAVSVDQGKRFGKTESNITARKPLMVRPSASRFMNFGDRIELPVVIQNQTDQDMAVDVAVRASNAAFTDRSDAVQTAGKRVVVKANSREELRFPASTIKAGTARFQFAVTSGKHSDAAEISLPVWTPATTEAFATYGTTDKNGAIFQPVQTPGDVYPQFGGLEVTTSSTQLQELTDAFIYLAKYPYACSEQIASRMISTAALRDVLQAFKAKETPTAEQLEAQFKRDIEILQSRQRSDGSFGLWKKDRERYEYPFLTVHVAHALALAKSKGYKVPDEMLNRTKPYLRDVEKYFNNEWYRSSPKVRWTISAYALYIRDMMGDRDAAKARKLLSEATIEKMPFEALGWVLSVLAKDKGATEDVELSVRFLLNRTTETAAAANFVTQYSDGGWLVMHSNRRADGVLLEALIKLRENAEASYAASVDDLIPKLVRGLLANRTKGHWGSTQENVFILLALDKYFNAFEKVTPDFVARVWLGSTYAGEQIFKGRSVDSNQLNIPMSYLVAQGGSSDLIIDRQGAGRLYYRIGMQYAPKNLKLDPADYGFTVIRKYEAVDNADDVRQNADGSWTIRSGARVRVRLTMVAQARRYHVALVDNLPAGLEILNPSLAVTESIPRDKGGNTGVIEVGSPSIGRNTYWWRQYWFEHQNFRDERAEAFASLLWEGVYSYTYVARATTPGRFVAPPAKAEEMYSPETFGRSGTDFVNVE